MKKKIVMLLTCLALSCTVLAACGDDDDTSTSKSGRSSKTSESTVDSEDEDDDDDTTVASSLLTGYEDLEDYFADEAVMSALEDSFASYEGMMSIKVSAVGNAARYDYYYLGDYSDAFAGMDDATIQTTFDSTFESAEDSFVSALETMMSLCQDDSDASLTIAYYTEDGTLLAEHTYTLDEE